MENNIKVFANNEFGQVRTLLRDGEPWFIAVDVCKALGIDPTATRRLDDDEKFTLRLIQGDSNRTSDTTIVNEPGLYSLVLGSRKPEAKAFKRWITHDVIPDIRKHGAYLTPETLERVMTDPDFLIGILTNLKEEREKRVQAESENKVLAEEKLKWADRPFINAVIRKYASGMYGNNFGLAWTDYKKELLYRHSINLNLRITNWLNEHGVKTKPKTLDMLTEDELPKAASTAVALCKAANVDISEYIPKNVHIDTDFEKIA